MKDLKIQVTCQCRACHGEGFVANAAWNAFWEQMHAWEQAHPKPPDPLTLANPDWAAYVAWNNRRMEVKWTIWAGLGHDDQPNEELPCPTCEGSGREAVELPLEALARYLGIEAGWPA